MSSVRCLILRDERGLVGATTLGYSVWHATADVMHPAIFSTPDDLSVAMGTSGTWRECSCPKPEIVDVRIVSEGEDLAPALSWPAKACLACRTLVETWEP